MTKNNAHAYCDESGNTGANLLDKQQPLFVVGGWLVNDGLIEAAENIIREQTARYSPKMKELHGASLLKSKKGTQLIFDLTMQLHQGCGSICQLVEKRMLLSFHIFDFFLNPEFNPRVPPWFEDYFDGKLGLIEAINNLPDEILVEFFYAFDLLDRSLLLGSLRNITFALSLRLETNLADLLQGCLLSFDKLINHHKTGRIHFDSVTMNTPNVASFHMFFQSLEYIGRLAKVPRIDLIHDESRQFAIAFPKIFKESRDHPGHFAFYEGPYEHSIVYRGFDTLKGFKFAKSKDEPLLQAADVLVSAVDRYATNVYKNLPSSPDLIKIAQFVFDHDDSSRRPVIRTSLSQRFADKLYDSTR